MNRLFPNVTALTFNGTFITDIYHIDSVPVAQPLIKDIAYPFTRGRRWMKLGSDTDDESSFGIQISHSPPALSIIYESSYSLLYTKLRQIETICRNSPILSVGCYLFATLEMRVQFSTVGAPKAATLADGTHGVQLPISVKASEYYQ